MNSDYINQNFPIVGCLRQTGGVIVVRAGIGDNGHKFVVPKRGGIRMLTAKSLNRLAYLVSTSKIDFRSILTLTYPKMYSQDGRAVKSDLNRFLTAIRRDFEGAEYVWFLEFQKRGAPHFHLILTFGPENDSVRETVANAWVKAVQVEKWYEKLDNTVSADFVKSQMKVVHMHNKTWEWVRSEKGAKAYALKYCTKPHQKEVPQAYQNVGRFWGASRGVKNDDIVWMSGTEDEVREFLGLMGRKLDKYEVLPKYIWTLDDWMPSE